MHPLGVPSTLAHSPTSQLSSTLQCYLFGLLLITRYPHPTAIAAALAAFSVCRQGYLHIHQNTAMANCVLAMLLDCMFVHYAMTCLMCFCVRFLLCHPYMLALSATLYMKKNAAWPRLFCCWSIVVAKTVLSLLMYS